jgi:hypothetical protein
MQFFKLHLSVPRRNVHSHTCPGGRMKSLDSREISTGKDLAVFLFSGSRGGCVGVSEGGG